MSRRVRLSDGIEIGLESGERVVADGRTLDGDINILSHAHGDHLYGSPPDHVVCSPLTAALASARRDTGDTLTAATHPNVELFASGHIAGSTAARINGGKRTYLFTGDVSTRDRFFLSGFEPVSADVLIIECTYGKPEYVFPTQASVEARFVDWLDETSDRPVIVFAYTLGRAQAVQLLVGRSDRQRLFTTESILKLNGVIEAYRDVSFGAARYVPETTLEAGDVLVLPSQTRRSSWVESLISDKDALTAGLSGWAIKSGFKYRGGFDETFPLSDHCGFDELLTVVEGVDPEIVYTQHGFTEEFASAIVSELGYDARALKKNQSMLDEF